MVFKNKRFSLNRANSPKATYSSTWPRISDLYVLGASCKQLEGRAIRKSMRMNGESPQWGRFGRYSGKNSTRYEQLTTEIFNSEKEFGYQQTISEISRVREVSLRKKKGKHRTLRSRLWTYELIFLGKDSRWIICEMIPDKWAGCTSRLWGRATAIWNPAITVWSDGLKFLSWKAPFLLLGILWGKH